VPKAVVRPSKPGVVTTDTSVSKKTEAGVGVPLSADSAESADTPNLIFTSTFFGTSGHYAKISKEYRCDTGRQTFLQTMQRHHS
jgi:hypothetical protein